MYQVNEGKRHFYSNNLPLAIGALHQALAINARCQEAHLYLGMIYYYTSNFYSAIDALNKVLAINPRSERAHFYLGCLYLDISNFEKAQNCFRCALDINPQSISTLCMLSACYFALDKLRDNMHYSELAIAITPTSDQEKIYKAAAFVFQNRSQEAERLALSLQNSQNIYKPDLYNLLGFIYERLDQCPKSIDYYTRGLAINPQYATLYSNRAFLYAWLQNYESCIEDSKSAFKLNPLSYKLHKALFMAYSGRGNQLDFLWHCLIARQLNPAMVSKKFLSEMLRRRSDRSTLEYDDNFTRALVISSTMINRVIFDSITAPFRLIQTQLNPAMASEQFLSEMLRRFCDPSTLEYRPFIEKFVRDITNITKANEELDVSLDPRLAPLAQNIFNYVVALLPQSSIRRLKLRGNLLKQENIEVFLHALSKCLHISSLDMSHNSLSNASIDPTICRHLPEFQRLTHLSLSNNHLEAIEMKRILLAAAQHPTLKEIDLTKNFITLSTGEIDELKAELQKRRRVETHRRLCVHLGLNFIQSIAHFLGEYRFSSDLNDTGGGIFQILSEVSEDNSLIDPPTVINQDKWIIFIMRNTGTTDPQHVNLLIEGVNDRGQKFIAKYDFRPQNGTDLGQIAELSFFAPTRSFHDRLNYRYFGFLVDRVIAQKLQDNIERDREKELFYQSLPKVIASSRLSYNCFTWALAKLRELRINAPNSRNLLPSGYLTEQKMIQPAMVNHTVSGVTPL